jgi:hypothetical protein
VKSRDERRDWRGKSVFYSKVSNQLNSFEYRRVETMKVCRKYSNNTNKMQLYTLLFIAINALHISGGSSAHHQELKTVYTAGGICRAFYASYRYRE